MQKSYPVAVQHIHCDHLGTPMAMTQAWGETAGQLALAGRQDAWGRITEQFDPEEISQPIRFQGQQYDEETGLHYNRFRYYDSWNGKYINQDPIRFAGGLNFYIYPLSATGKVDPWGLAATGSVDGAAKEVTIALPISISGEKATPALAASWGKAINSQWNKGAWKYKNCKVKIKASVTCGGKWADNATAAAKDTVNPEINQKNRSTVTGGSRGHWFENDVPWVTAHEAGHMMGCRINTKT